MNETRILNKTDRLQELLNKFRNDGNWFINGLFRFDNKLLWIESMVHQYSEVLGLSLDETVELIESKRTYSWPNYYQEANFPKLDNENLIGVFETFDEFNEHAKKNYIGFKCKSCGSIGDDPQNCVHRIADDGICDWTSYGLFKSKHSVIILESGLSAIPIFEPMIKSK